jgi:Spy/CpxP family protein refolding chaperone
MSDVNMPGPATAPAKRRRWLGPAFLMSLVVNLFLVGLIVSSFVAHRPSMHPGGGPFMFSGIRGDLDDMSKEDRAFMRKIMVRQFKTIRPQIEEMNEARKALAEVVGETPYDPAKVSAAFDRMDQAQAAMARNMRAAMIKGFSEMSDEQRQRMSKAMAKGAEHHRRHKDKDKDKDDDDRPHRDRSDRHDRPMMP